MEWEGEILFQTGQSGEATAEIIFELWINLRDAMDLSWGKAFRAEGTVTTKALRKHRHVCPGFPLKAETKGWSEGGSCLPRCGGAVKLPVRALHQCGTWALRSPGEHTRVCWMGRGSTVAPRPAHSRTPEGRVGRRRPGAGRGHLRIGGKRCDL